MTLRHYLAQNKGRRCEAKLLCYRRPAGSVIVEPLDDEGNSLGQLAIWVCGKHKERAMEAARLWGINYENEHREKLKREANNA